MEKLKVIDEVARDDVIEIYYSPTFYGTEAIKKLPKYSDEIYTKKYADLYSNYAHAHDKVIFAMSTSSNQCLGFISFSFNDDMKLLNIISAYVIPSYRKKNTTEYSKVIYDELFAALIEKHKDKAPVHIFSGVHKNNIAVQKAMERQGRVLAGYYYTFDIAKENNG